MPRLPAERPAPAPGRCPHRSLSRLQGLLLARSPRQSECQTQPGSRGAAVAGTDPSLHQGFASGARGTAQAQKPTAPGWVHLRLNARCPRRSARSLEELVFVTAFPSAGRPEGDLPTALSSGAARGLPSASQPPMAPTLPQQLPPRSHPLPGVPTAGLVLLTA